MTNPTSKVKKYGKAYANKDKLRHGDIKLIQRATGRSYVNILQQLDGYRAIRPEVKAMADKLVERNQALIDAIDNINVNTKK